LSIIYLASVQTKMAGQSWLQGTAVSYALRLEDMQRLPPPHWVTTNALIMNAATWGAMAVELAVGVLVWNRRCRPWVLAAGVALHLGIDINIEVGIFSYAMFVLYLAWISPETVHRLPGTVKRTAAKAMASTRHRPPPEATSAPVGRATNGREHRPSEQISISLTSAIDEHGNSGTSPAETR
jgi:hypothetical protein